MFSLTPAAGKRLSVLGITDDQFLSAHVDSVMAQIDTRLVLCSSEMAREIHLAKYFVVFKLARCD